MPDDTPWYDTIVMPALLRWARGAYGEAMRKALAKAGCDDIPSNGLFVIGGLALGAGDVPLSALVRDLKVSKQAAGQLVDTLVLRGYLKREVDEADRRRFTVALTERGQHAAAVLRLNPVCQFVRNGPIDVEGEPVYEQAGHADHSFVALDHQHHAGFHG